MPLSQETLAATIVSALTGDATIVARLVAAVRAAEESSGEVEGAVSGDAVAGTGVGGAAAVADGSGTGSSDVAGAGVREPAGSGGGEVRVEVTASGDDGSEASGDSWADQVEAEVASSSSGVVVVSDSGVGDSVSLPVRQVPFTSRERGVVPDGPAGFGRATDTSAADGAGFMATYVRTSAVKAFAAFVGDKAGVRISKARMAEFALCAYTTGTLPLAFVDGKRRLKQLETVGDAALTLHLVMSKAVRGLDVEGIQAARSRVTSNGTLQNVCVSSGLSQFVTFPRGVDLRTSKVTANAFESVVGFLAIHLGEVAVGTFLRNMQLL